MKKAIIIAAIVTAISVISAVSTLWGLPGGLVGSGNLETEEYAFTDFTEVEIGTAFEFEIKQSSSYSINVTADDNVIDYVQVSQDGQTLKIRLRRVVILGPVTLRASVTMPQLHGLTASGASHGTVSDFSSTEDLDITVSGGSIVTGDITAGDAYFDLSGGSQVNLQGMADDLDVNGSGGSQLELEAFFVNNADVNLSGGGRATVNVNGTLDANLSGGSTLWYIGEPTSIDINTSGASSVIEK